MLDPAPARRPSGVVVQHADEGEAIWAMGSLFEVKAGAEDTDGELSAMLVTQPPGIATPLHVHSREAEAFFVLDGTLDYEAGGELFHLAAGAFIWLPLGVPHRFRTTGERPVRFLALGAPGGLDGLYRAVGVSAGERRIPDAYPAEPEIARWQTAGAEHGMEVLGPPLPG
jgi:quercetin dioxygenase-like cupin family protein